MTEFLKIYDFLCPRGLTLPNFFSEVIVPVALYVPPSSVIVSKRDALGFIVAFATLRVSKCDFYIPTIGFETSSRLIPDSFSITR